MVAGIKFPVQSYPFLQIRNRFEMIKQTPKLDDFHHPTHSLLFIVLVFWLPLQSIRGGVCLKLKSWILISGIERRLASIC